MVLIWEIFFEFAVVGRFKFAFGFAVEGQIWGSLRVAFGLADLGLAPVGGFEALFKGSSFA